MGDYLLRRGLWTVLTLFGMLTFAFFLFNIVPGDVVSAMLAEGATSMSAEWAVEVRHEMGLDRPMLVQYVDWLWGFVHLDLGRSLWTGESVARVIALRLPITLQLVAMSVAISIIVGIPLGIAAALKQDTWVDYVARAFLITGLSIPDFVLGLLIILVLSFVFSWFPPLEYANILSAPWTAFQQLMFPAIVLGYRQAAVGARMMRSCMLEVINEDYVRTAKAKGLSGRAVVWRHVLKNAMLPVVTIFGVEMVLLFSGAVIIERLFAVPGIGTLVIEAMMVRDLPMVQGSVMVIGIFVLATNILADMVYAILDPRISYR